MWREPSDIPDTCFTGVRTCNCGGMKMNQCKINQLVQTFEDAVHEIFMDNLVFAFIFGSVAKGRYKKTSDIDMFVCTMNKPSAKQKADFFEFYMRMHQEYGFFPDKEYPGELVSLEFLQKNIEYIKNWIPHREIRTYREFEAVFWTAVLAEQKLAVVDGMSVLQNMEEKCNRLVKKWKRMVASVKTASDLDELSLLEVLTREGCKFLVRHRPEYGDFWK